MERTGPLRTEFFPPGLESSEERGRIDRDPELLLDRSGDLTVGDLVVRGAELLGKTEDLAPDLAGPLRTGAEVEEGGEPSLLEPSPDLIDGGTGDTEVAGGAGDAEPFGEDPPSHLVADLEEVASVEELVREEEMVLDPLRVRVEGAARPEPLHLRCSVPWFGHHEKTGGEAGNIVVASWNEGGAYHAAGPSPAP